MQGRDGSPAMDTVPAHLPRAWHAHLKGCFELETEDTATMQTYNVGGVHIINRYQSDSLEQNRLLCLLISQLLTIEYIKKK